MATYLVIAIGRLPGFQIDRTGATLVGASLLVALGVLPLEEAYRAIDFDTIILLLGIMIIVAHLRLSKIFRLINVWALSRAHHPKMLLASVTLVSGLLSALLVNDTVCLVLTPLVLDFLAQLRRNPVPYLLALAMASNIGSLATITGNPQNMIIASLSHISYAHFTAALAPVAVIGLVLTVAAIMLAYPTEFRTRQPPFGADIAPVHANWPLIVKSVVVLLGMVAGFFVGANPSEVALIGGSLLLVTGRVKAERVYAEIDWPLLLMFAGLFIVVAGLEKTVLSPELLDAVGRLHLESLPVLAGITVILSNLVSNVPAVLALKPFVISLADQQQTWLTIAMASTFAGNLTVLGSVANLIVLQGARAQGVTISFWEHFRIGAPLTVLTTVIGVLWLVFA
jgi:Na+/H+ antiporter NhaD/arsenite permease-like protein